MSENTEKIIYSMYRLSKTHRTKTVLKEISLSYYYGAKIGVLGLNGAGKSTLLRIMAGVDGEFDGEASMNGNHTVGYLPQEPVLDDEKTVFESVAEAVASVKALLDEYEALSLKFAEPMDDDAMNGLIEKQGEVQEKIDFHDAWNLDSKLEMAMDALRCPPPETKIGVLSGGEKRRVALCRLLLEKPDVLLLDEPTNHLDTETVAWLEHHLQAYEGTVIAITHDRYFLDNVAGWILELDRGEGIPWKGNYSSWLEQKQQRLEREEKAGRERRKTLERELEWIHTAQKGRQSKPQARINAYEQLLASAKERNPAEMQICFPPPPRLGKRVIEADRLTKAYEGKLLFENLSFAVPPAAVVGIVGANGAGKTTLFNLITGREKQDAGSIKIGETVRMSYVDQTRAELNEDQTVWEAISGGNDVIRFGSRELNSRAYVGRFNFSGQDQQMKLSELSGGARNRVHLAAMIRREANLILLDEPTNDLDVNTLSALESAVEDFAGCLMIVSHDRWFLDRIATHVLAFEGDSKVVWFEGGYADYEKDRKRRLGKDAEIPKRIKYRQFTR